MILDRMNKAIIKTIKMENNEIIDCYDIYRQPSINHPLLQNHIIQMKPSSYPTEIKSNNFGTLQLIQTWHKYGSCPEGTIPILRKGKNYNPIILRKDDHPKLSPYKIPNASQPSEATRGHEVNGNFLGAQVKINIWKPVTKTQTEISISQIWVTAGDSEGKNTIEAGWMKDGYKSSGCFNLLCAGFVQTASDFCLGGSFTETSTFNGVQKDANFSIHKDQIGGQWWVQIQGKTIGYYPSSLFTELSMTSIKIHFGGEISNNRSKDDILLRKWVAVISLQKVD